MSKPKGSRRRKVAAVDESLPSGTDAVARDDAADAADAAPGMGTAPDMDAAPAADADAAPVGPAPVTLELDASLEIKDVEAVHRRISAALAGASTLTINLNRIATVDTAGVQLLLALRRSAGPGRRPISFTGASAALTQALGVLGLDRALDAGAAGG